MKKLLLILLIIQSVWPAVSQEVEVVGQESRSAFENKSYSVIRSLKLLPGFKASRATDGVFFARMNGFEVTPQPYSYAATNTQIQISKLGSIPEMTGIDNFIHVFGTRSGKIAGVWNLSGEILEFTPSSAFLIGESITVLIHKDLTIQGGSESYLGDHFEWMFRVSPESTADSPVNFSLEQNIVPLGNPIADASSIPIDLNDDGITGVLVYENPPYYFQSNGSSFEEIPTIFPEIQSEFLFTPSARIIGSLDVDDDSDADLIFKRAVTVPITAGTEEIIILQNNGLDFTTEFLTFDLNGIYDHNLVHDIDKDGIQDLLVRYHSTSFEDYVTVFLSSSNFQIPVTTQISDVRRNGLELIDINADGIFEALIGETIYSLEEDGTLTFIVNTNALWIETIAIKDLDKNGLPDMVGFNGTEISLIRNDGNFNPKESVYDKEEHHYPSFIYDINGDYETDILVLKGTETAFSTDPLTNGSFTSEGLNQWWTINNFNTNHLIDMDLDGDLDIASFGGNGLSWYENSSNEAVLISFTVDNPAGITTNLDHINKVIDISLSDISVDLSSSTINFAISENASMTINSQIVSSGSVVELFDFNQVQIIAEDGKTTSDWTINVLRPTFDMIVQNQNARISPTDQISISFSEDVMLADLSSYAIVSGEIAGVINGSWVSGATNAEAQFTPSSPYLNGDQINVSFPSTIRNALSNKNLIPKNIQRKVISGISYKNPPEFSDIRTTHSGGYRKQIPKDIDGDGDIDFILHRRNSSNLSEVHTILNDNGVFGSPQTVLSISESVSEVFEPHDFNGDGTLDYLYLALSNQAAKLVVHGLIELPTSNINYRSNVEIGDIDGNGVSDIIYGRGENIEIVMLDRPESLQSIIIETPSTVRGIDLYDYDYDGDLDILFTRGVDIEVYINQGNSQYSLDNLNIDNGSISGINTINKIIASDVDNDGDTDLVLGGTGNSDYIAKSTGSGYEYSLLKVNNYLFDLHLADINGDNIEEVVFNPYEWTSLSDPVDYFKHDEIVSGFNSGDKILFADLDNDSDIDIITYNGWFENFSNKTQITEFELSYQVGEAVIGSGYISVNILPSVDLQSENLIATFTLSDGAVADINGVPQVSGVTENNFGNNVFYTVTAEDGHTEQQYSVTVSNATFNMVSSNPGKNEHGVAINSGISIQLEEEPSSNSDLNQIKVHGQLSGIINGTWTYTSETISFTPSSPFIPGEYVTIHIPDEVILNLAENSLLNGHEIRFKVGIDPSESNPAYFESLPVFASITGDIESLSSHDVNNDGLIDFVITQGGNSTLFVNNGDDSFAEHSFVGASNIISSIIGDWDENTNPNILLKSNGINLYDYEFTGASLNLVRTLNIEASASRQMDFYDFNIDGTLDLVYNRGRIIVNDLANTTFTDQVFIFNPPSSFEDFSLSGINKFNRLQLLHTNDDIIQQSFTGTVPLDYHYQNALGNITTGANQILITDFSGGFPPFSDFSYKIDNVVEGKFTSDNNSGILLRVIKDDSPSFNNPDSIFYWATAPSFYAFDQTLPFVNFVEYEVGDINGDGLDDISVIYDGKFSWFESQNGSFTEHIISSSLQSPKDLVLVDIDGDNDLDIIYSSLTGGDRKLSVFENTLPPPPASPVGTESDSPILTVNTINGITLYPNPANDYLELKGDLNSALVKVYDLNGKKLADYENNNSGSMIIDTSEFPSGIYALKIETSTGGLIERKVVIKH